MSGDIADGGKLVLLVLFKGGFVKVDMLIELSSLLVIDTFQLFEELITLGWIRDLLIMLDQMLLLEFVDSFKD